MQRFTYTSGGEEIMDRARELWEKLNRIYTTSSSDFGAYYAGQTWVNKKGEICRRSRKAGIKVELAYEDQDQKPVGFCIAYVTKENEGELDSIFVEEEFRNSGLGDRLMISALNWFKYQGASKVRIAVTPDNESVIRFCEKHGFSPRVVVMESHPSARLPCPADGA